jgi:predicted ATPase
MVLGDTPNIAARLQDVAAPNTLVISALTHQILGGLFAYESLGTPPLKGVAAPLEVYRVLYESTARTRLDALASTGLTPLVGREAELRSLEAMWDRATDGRGYVVLVTGEAGIGKSRLVKALTDHASARQAWFTHLQCSPYYQHTAFYPLIDLMERIVLRFERDDSLSQKQSKLEGFLVESGLPLSETVPLFSTLLSIPLAADYVSPEIPAEQQKQQTMRALMTIPFRRAEKQPVMLIVEDLHWVDPTTLEYLNNLVDAIPAAPILAVFTCRPDFSSPWTEHPNVTTMELNRLPSGAAAELSNQVAQGKSLPPQVLAEVVAKTDGVPLFIEELTKMLLESGLLEEQPDHYALTGPLPPLAIPNTLQDSLMARLDRLASVKGLAQLGAALGREFSYALLHAVSPWDDETLRQGLEQLVAAEFLYQDGVPPDATYRFKHALIQDAAYQSLLKSTRQQHHQRIATTSESEFPETVETQPELLAHHYTEAGLTEQAVPYWHAAANRALRRHANQEAANHATRGLELLATLPDTPHRAERELRMQQILGPAQNVVTGPLSVEHVHARACELARQVGDTAAMFPALSGLAYANILRGQLREARALADEYLTLAEPHHDALVLAAGHWMVAYVAWWQGDIIDVRDHGRRGLDFYNPDQHLAGIAAYNQNPGIVCGYLDALADWVLGYPTQATQAMNRTLAHARELEHPYSVAVVLLFSAKLAQLRRDHEPARDLAEEALKLSTEIGAPAVTLWCLLPRGWARAQQSDVAAGIQDIEEAMERRRAFRMGAVWPWYLALIADAYGAAGRIDDGFRALDEAADWERRNDERLYAAEARRIRGELLLAQDVPDPAQAEGCFQEALTVARDQQAKSWELRAAMSMARMWLQQNRVDEARALLAPIYGWFTEGFDTPDLIEAKTLLDQL